MVLPADYRGVWPTKNAPWTIAKYEQWKVDDGIDCRVWPTESGHEFMVSTAEYGQRKVDHGLYSMVLTTNYEQRIVDQGL